MKGFGGKEMIQFTMPGSEELAESMFNKEVESDFRLEGIDAEWENEQMRINMMVGDRGKRPNGFVHKETAKPWPVNGKLDLPKKLQLIQNAGGLQRSQKNVKDLKKERE